MPQRRAPLVYCCPAAAATPHEDFSVKITVFVVRFFVIIAASGPLTAQPPGVTEDYPAALVLYAAIAPHDVQLHVADGAGSNVRSLLAEPQYDYNGSISPDGQWVVFTSEREGTPDIYRVRVDGSGIERLTDHAAFDDAGVLSPDGRSIAFVSTRDKGNANLWLLELASGRLVNLTPGRPATTVLPGRPTASGLHFLRFGFHTAAAERRSRRRYEAIPHVERLRHTS